MTNCTVILCHNASEKENKVSGVSFHRFPSDPVKAGHWIKIIRRCRNEECWNPSKNTRICSGHFEDKYMYTTKSGQRRLHRDAVPTKNLHIMTCPHQDNTKDNSILSENRNNAKTPSMEQRLDSSTSQENSNEKAMPIQEELHPNTSRISPIEDDMESIFDTPRKARLRKKLKKRTLLHIKHTKIIKSLRQKNRLLKKKNKTLKQILYELKKQRFINNDVSNILTENIFAAELYNSLVKKFKNKRKRPMPKYTPEFRKFCLTLHFYSPQGYNYVRKTFNTCLPHPKTIYNWYRSIDGSPGFTDEAFKILKLKAESTNKKLICNLVADEMAIRPQNIKGGHGDVDIGSGSSGSTNNSIKATEAYVFLLVCQNEHWKIPVGYFLIHGLSGCQKKSLINVCLTKCHEAGIKVVSLTFDGHPTNISAMELLGCNVKNPENLKTTFKHPVADHNVAVFLDICHMVKLVRNHFEDKKTLLDKDSKEINWDYLKNLNELQEKEGLHAANKLSRKHLEFRNSIMKVKLATQLLSKSVAISLNFCRDVLKLDAFKESEATEKFILLLNNIFDIFNSRRLAQYGFSHPLSSSNKNEILEYLAYTSQYLLNLKIKMTRKRTYKENDTSIKVKLKGFESVLKTNTSTGFKGILICIESLKYLYVTLVEGTHEMGYMTTYRLSQDHIELFFGMIRMNGGHNDNPNALQFKGAYRKLLCRMELQTGDTGNCVPLENVPILTCSSALQCINSTTVAERFDHSYDHDIGIETEECPIEIDFDYLSASIDDPDFKNHIVGYIAGNVVRHISKKIKCSYCIESMLSNETQWYHKLVTMRDNGGLVYASKEVYSICAVTENYLRQYIAQNNNLGRTSEVKLALVITKNLIGRPLFSIEEHVNSHHHLTNLVRLIIERYLRIRFFYESTKDNMARRTLSKRQLFRKQIQLTGF